MELYGEYIVRFNGSNFAIGEPLVRCRDCYFADEVEGGYWCDRFGCGKEHVTPDGFCKWGERKVVSE